MKINVLSIIIIISLCAGCKEDTKKMQINNNLLKKKLTPLQYKVTRECGTEPAFQNKYWDNHKEGIYVDIVSGEVLFSSTDKFESGTGWPSFTKPVKKENIIEKSDSSHGMTRTEVKSKIADSHLGHVFDDGPGPAGLRYCINSASLRFIPADEMEKEGYSDYLYLFRKEQTGEIAIFAGGCFWCMEGPFEAADGVKEVLAGYTGGTKESPSYEEVSSGSTQHYEAIKIIFDPKKISYAQLLDIFWRQIDPTDNGGQFADRGSQYFTAIFYMDEKQKNIAEQSKKELAGSGKFSKPVVTKILKAGVFYPAEDYHQDYYKKNTEHYKKYKKGSGREDFIIRTWKK